jgi:2',3'-cyclic-nucleotide 2'-phosphodiesterase (5'-nucleotidase family)
MLSRPSRWFVALAVVLVLPRAQAAPEHVTLTILHTNDLHGRVLPLAYKERGYDAAERPSVGGLARRATLIRRIRQTTGNPVVAIDCGDIIARGPLWTTYLGAPEIDALNATDYDLAAIGNNEFKLKAGVDWNDAAGAQAALFRIIRRSHFQWLCANVTDATGAWLPGVKPYVVRTLGGVRVGFLALTSARAREYPQTKGMRFTDPIPTAREWVPKVRAECDVLIALTHIGALQDRALAAAVSGIDAIVGGDSHTFIHQAVNVRNPAGVDVPIVQAGEHGVYVGRLDLQLDRDAAGSWKATVKSYALLPVGPDLAEDAAVAKALEPSVKPFRMVIGHRPALAGAPEERARQTKLLFAEALRQAASADLALVTDDGFQDVLRSETITRYNLFSAWPFRDHIVTVSASGEEIAKLRDAHTDAALAGAPALLEPARRYRLALVDFAATGTLKMPASRVTDTGIDVRDAVIAYLRKGVARATHATPSREAALGR